MRPLIDLPLQSQYTDGGLMVTRNQGSLSGSVQLGDGVTVGSFPTRVRSYQRGFGFNGNQYLELKTPIPNATYTAMALLSRQSNVGSQVIIDCRQSGGANVWYWDQPSNSLSSAGGTVYVNGEPNALANNMPYGQVVVAAAAGIVLSAPGSTVIGMRYTYTLPWIGNIHGFRLYSGTLTPTQIRDQGQYMMSRLNLNI